MSDIFNEDYLVSSPDYESVLSREILPFLNTVRNDQILFAEDRTPLFSSVFSAEKPVGTILLLHGFTENTFKYSELFYSLLQNHYSVVAYDQRGHGRSGRPDGISNPSVTHVENFSYYVDDLRHVCITLLQKMQKPWYIFAHSMGGAVASLYLEEYRDTFSKAVLCAPMIAPNVGSVPVTAAIAICRLFCFLGKGKQYPFFMKPYSGPEDFFSSCATDPVRFNWYDHIKYSYPYYQNSVPTYRWTLESIRVTKQILRPGAPESIQCPVLLCTAELDSSVMPDPQKEFISRVPQGKHLFVKSAKHEIFRSVNDVFFPWWHRVLTFFQEG